MTSARLLGALGLSLELCAVACSNDRVLVAPDLPPSVTWVATLLWDEGGSLVHATGLARRGAAGAFDLKVDAPGAGDAARISVVGFEESQLAAYGPAGDDGLAATPLAIARSGQRKLPEPPAFSGCAALSKGTMELEGCELPALTSAWLSACPTACDLFPLGAPRPITLPGATGGARFAVPEAGIQPAALVYTNDDQIFRVTPSDAVLWTKLSTRASISSGYSRADGTLMLVTSRAAVLSVRPLEPEVVLARGGAPGLRASRIVGAPSGPIDAFVADSEGQLFSFDGLQLNNFYTATADGGECCASRLLWRGARQLVAAISEANKIVFYRDGELTVDTVIRDPRALADAPGLGLVVATAGEAATRQPPELFVYREGRWVLLEAPEGAVGEIPREIWPMNGGFVYGGLRGRLSYYHPGLGTCGPRSFGELNIDSGVVFPGALLFTISITPPNGESAVVWTADRVTQFPSTAGCIDP